jgi:choline kinase
VIGLVLAAGSGRRLMPYTQHLPKTLLPLSDERTILDVIVHNLASCGIQDVVVVVGHMAPALESRVPELQRQHRVAVRLIHNDRIDWNNAYSLWLARNYFAEGALLVNGDTVHPATIERALLDADGAGVGVRLAVDTVKQLTDEAMKVELDDADRIIRITKDMPITQGDGEYIGAAVLDPYAAPDLTACLEQTWQTDPGQYYEDGLQLFAARTGAVQATRIGTVDWVEVDDVADLSLAREIACRY